MTSERIDKAIEIINYAINNKTSVKNASVKCGYADTYVKNVKAMVYEKYENQTLEDELFSKFNEAYERYFTDTVGIESKIKQTNKPINAVDNEKTSYREFGKQAEYEWVGGKNYPKDHIRTVDQLLAAANVDLDVWSVKDSIINKWDATSWKSGVAETVQNFQVKIKLEKNIEIFNYKNAADIFIDLIKDYQPPVLYTNNASTLYNVIKTDKENNLLEISIFDLHLGKLCWSKETGEDYDVKIASKRFMDAIETLLHRASGFNYERILFPVGNDFFNSDTILNTTTAGTFVDEDLRWQKTFNIGTRLLVDGINLLKQTGVPIDVIIIPGNHDLTRSYYMGSFLEAWFNNDDMVHINNGASPRKYYKYGKVLLGLTHGNEEKESSLPLLMATDTESKPYWSDTVYHEFHVGHFHRKKNVTFSVIDNKSIGLKEDLGVTVRYLSSLSGTDSWHNKKGYNSIKAADAFIWNDENGLVAHLNSNLKLE